jgi:xanthine dehydrogenase accessory factor
VHEAVFAAALQALERGEEAALVTIVSTQGSTPQRVGARMLVFADGRIIGTIGGGCYENDAAGKARDSIRTRKAGVARYDLSDGLAEENGLICGGRMEVFIEPLDPSPRLVVAGAGHVSQHVATLASGVGFRVQVLDDREKFANRERFPSADEITVAPIDEYLAEADLPPAAYVLIVTRGHTHDLSALRALAGRPLRYVGMIGSRAKVARIFDALSSEGVAAGWLGQVHAPVGLDIGAITPEEIAVSIVAELIAVRRRPAAGGSDSLAAMRDRH